MVLIFIIEVHSISEPTPIHYSIVVSSKHGCPVSPAPESPPPVDIYVVVHSHDDVGWKNTVMVYIYLFIPIIFG